MRTWMLGFVLLLPLSSYAINEVECSGRDSSNQRVVFEIEQSWGGSIRDARLLIYSDSTNNPEETVYRIFNMRPQNRRMLYSGTDGVRLEIDIFPDRAPRWGRSYRAQLSASHEHVSGLSCRFPQVRP